MKSITRTEFDFPKQSGKYVGKVRDVYTIDNKYLVMESMRMKNWNKDLSGDGNT